ncbi:hypothetical protein [Corynebacterium caspium]|uniref:hypothetical protein n=1 Tax=Corynebacterium caspium TaxID=234828 RepID=UPI00037DE81E|nr:hypothetical protein [Corynebacterium caspium]WKD59697.1 hypothetical protein CCASP_06590 [Corynebacterium caspium DSM 44850]
MNTKPAHFVPASTVPVPQSVRMGAVIALIQCAVGLGYAFFLIGRQILGYEAGSIATSKANTLHWVGTGTAIFMIIIFGTVTAGAIIVLRGSAKRWGRGPVITLQMLLLPISFQMFSGIWWLGAITLVSAVLALGCLLNPRAFAWAAASYRS